MKKYLLLYYGTEVPDPEARDRWMRWFAALGDRVIDSGNPLGASLEVGGGSARLMTWAEGATMGYSIVSAASLEDAARLLDGCPAERVRISEAVPM